MVRFVQLLACAVIAGIAAPAIAQTPPEDATVVVNGQRPAPEDADRRVCRREIQTGSVMSRRVCRSQAERNNTAAGAQSDLDRLRQQERSRGNVGQSRQFD